MRTEVEIFGKTLKNPLLPASGTYGYGEAYESYYAPNELGALISKGITWNPKPGNEGIRIWETPSGILNSIGLENPGIHEFLNGKLQKMQTLNENIIVNLGGNTIEEYINSVELLNEHDFFAIELNISCPNVKEGGMAFGIESETAAEVTKIVKAHTEHNLIVKLSPNARDVLECAKAVEEAGADSVSLINTVLGMAIDPYAERTVFNNVYAGLSGPAVKPIALRMVHQVAKNVSIPVIAAGGISTGLDVAEFMMAGATLAQIGTANFMNPNAVMDILKDFEEFLKGKNITAKDLIGIV